MPPGAARGRSSSRATPPTWPRVRGRWTGCRRTTGLAARHLRSVFTLVVCALLGVAVWRLLTQLVTRRPAARGRAGPRPVRAVDHPGHRLVPADPHDPDGPRADRWSPSTLACGSCVVPTAAGRMPRGSPTPSACASPSARWCPGGARGWRGSCWSRAPRSAVRCRDSSSRSDPWSAVNLAFLAFYGSGDYDHGGGGARRCRVLRGGRPLPCSATRSRASSAAR